MRKTVARSGDDADAFMTSSALACLMQQRQKTRSPSFEATRDISLCEEMSRVFAQGLRLTSSIISMPFGVALMRMSIDWIQRA